jgi:hypothetical protein
MATKEAVFSLRVDTGNSVQDIQNADQAVKNFNKDLKETQATAASGTGIDAFQQNLDELNAKVSAGGLTMRDMARTMKEYQTIAAQAGVESPVGQQAIQAAAQLKDEIGDLKNATTALSSDFVGLDTAMAGVETGAAVFQGVQSAVALTGVENEKLMQTMIKLQAVQGVVNAVNTVANKLNKDAILGIQVRNGLTKISNFIATGSASTTAAQAAASAALATAQTGVAVSTGVASGAMKAFRIALISTGIGAVVVLAAALIASFQRTGAEAEASAIKIEGLEKQLESLADSHKFEADINDALGERIILQAKLRGASSRELMELEKKNMQDSINQRLQQLHEIQKTNAKIINDENHTAEALTKAQQATSAAYQETRLILQKAENERVNFQLQAQDIDKQESEDAKKKADEARQRREQEKQKAEADRQARKQKADQLKNEEIQRRNDLLKDLNNNINREIEIRENLEDSKIKLMADGLEKEVATLNETYGDWRQELLNKSIAKEVEALDQKFTKGKMTEIEYRAELEKINLSAIEKLSESEKTLITQKELELKNEILRITKENNDAVLLAAAELETKKLELRKQFQTLMNDEFENEKMNFVDSQKEQLKQLEEGLKTEAITQFEFDQALIKMEKDKIKTIEEINKKALDAKKLAERTQREEELKGITAGIAVAEDALKKIKMVNDLLDEIGTARINKINKERDEDLESLDAQKEAELNAEGLTAEQKTAIEQKFAKQKYDVQLDAFNKEDKINRAKFNRDKAIKLAEVGINTASAIVKGIAEFGPPPSPLGIAAIATAGVIGVTQALAITNQKYKGGTMPTMPSVSSSTGGGLAGSSASSFTSQPTTQTSTTGLTDGQSITAPVQVFVLENDISSTQNKVALQESKSSF